MKERVVVTTLLLGVLVSSGAAAQGFQAQGSTSGGFSTSGQPYYPPPRKALDNVGKDGQFIFSIERITGLFIDQQKLEYTRVRDRFEHTVSSTSFGVFGMDSNSPSALPRFALDYVVYGGLTVGANFMLSGRSYSVEGSDGQRPATVPSAAPDGLTFLAGGRVGFAYAFDETFGIWPRAGLGYATTSSEYEIVNPVDGEAEGNFESEAHFLDANLELLGVISPVEHIVLFAGPYLDLGLAGGYSVEERGVDGDLDRRDAHLTSFGFLVHAGGYY